MNDVIAPYRLYLTRSGKSQLTVRAYGDDVDHFAQWFEPTTGQSFAPHLVDPRDIRDYRGYLQRQDRAPSTINRKLRSLKSFFQWCRREKLVQHSPFEILENFLVKQQHSTAPRWLSYREQMALLRAVRTSERSRDIAMVQLFLDTGLRVSELVALEVDDIDISERKGELRVRAGKGNKARMIPLSLQARRELQAYLDDRGESDSSRLFLGQRGPLNVSGVQYLIDKYAYIAKLENCTAHTLRHTFAKKLVDVQTPLDQVAALLGHESLEATKIYTRPSQQDLERAIRRASGEVT